MRRAIKLFLAVAVLASSVARPAAPDLRTVLPQIKPPTKVLVTTMDAVVLMSKDLTGPFSPLTGFSTNKTVAPANMEVAFFSAIATNFPVTNLQARVSWNTVEGAQSYWINVGDSKTNWNQRIETLNKTQLTFKVWRCYETNTLAMTSVSTNGAESELSKVIIFKPTLRIAITNY